MCRQKRKYEKAGSVRWRGAEIKEECGPKKGNPYKQRKRLKVKEQKEKRLGLYWWVGRGLRRGGSAHALGKCGGAACVGETGPCPLGARGLCGDSVPVSGSLPLHNRGGGTARSASGPGVILEGMGDTAPSAVYELGPKKAEEDRQPLGRREVGS